MCEHNKIPSSPAFVFHCGMRVMGFFGVCFVVFFLFFIVVFFFLSAFLMNCVLLIVLLTCSLRTHFSNCVSVDR